LGNDSEIERIRAEYARRSREIPAGFYGYDRAANLFSLHSRERALRDALSDHARLPLTQSKLLEVGCGSGEWFPTFVRLGLAPDDLSGIDLERDRLEKAKAAFHAADLRVGDASALPWPDGFFDVVFQSTVFSSILDDQTQASVAREMMRVLKPRGRVVWYDFSYNNPQNPAVRGIGARRIRELFPSMKADVRKVTLAPPLARRLVPLSHTLSTVLESLKVLNTHLLVVLRR
jgi:ubiquinone/menaquinone biosynthesis C-methylase UbiE